ncbi:hypothetical protein L596_018681 [Steinernema carpocapsae]|uniref:Ribosomal RNA-processing protein 43 n=1 Tax=Steinernema carpocapsae TaxID=34508 RepID=A0A4U5N5L2_STECR|nr:hypothetical protein L596_018681 [Steinernema carpocapsae]
MSAEHLKHCDPKEYYEQHLLEGAYPDGRSIIDFRGTSVQVGFNPTVRGSSLVKQSGSMVDVTIDLKLKVKNEPLEPEIVFEIEGPESIEETVIDDAHMILDQLKENGALFNLDAVTATDPRLMWSVVVNIQFLSCDTASIDALVTAVSAALLNTRIPEVHFAEEIDEDAPLELEKVVITDKTHPLKMLDVPTSSCFALYKTGTKENSELLILSDPPSELMEFTVSSCIFVVGEGEAIHSMLLAGGETIEMEKIKKMHGLAQRRHESVAIALKNITGRLTE